MVKELDDKTESIDEAHRALKMETESTFATFALKTKKNKYAIAENSEKLAEHDKEIEALKNMGGTGGGSNFDLNQLSNIFARKDAPDNTIKRIEQLEEQMKGVFDRLDSNDDSLKGMDDLKNRVASLETRADGTDKNLGEHNGRITWCEDEIKKLKAILENMGTGDQIDSTAIMMKLNMLTEEVKTKAAKADLEKLRLDMQAYTDQACADLSKKVESKIDSLRHEMHRLRADFESFVKKEFSDLVLRVEKLEKRLIGVEKQLNGFSRPVE